MLIDWTFNQLKEEVLVNEIGGNMPQSWTRNFERENRRLPWSKGSYVNPTTRIQCRSISLESLGALLEYVF